MPPPSCSVVPEASEVACNLHAASSELLYPPNDEGFTVSTMGQCDTHALPSFPSVSLLSFILPSLGGSFPWHRQQGGVQPTFCPV